MQNCELNYYLARLYIWKNETQKIIISPILNFYSIC